MRKSDGEGDEAQFKGEQQQPKDTTICGIVFLERRHVAFILNKLLVELCNWDQDLFFIKSHTITDKPGTKKKASGQPDMQFKKQEEVDSFLFFL